MYAFLHALGAAQGLFLVAVLLSRDGPVANRLLAAVMLAFSADLGMAVYHATGAVGAFPHLIGLDYPLALLYGPLLYLYARALAEGAYPARMAWHFVPFLAVVASLVPFFVRPVEAKLLFLSTGGGGAYATYLSLANNAKLAHAFVYILLTLRVLRRHRQRIRDQFSSLERINLAWLRNLMVLIVVVMILSVGLHLMTLVEGRAGPGLGLDPESLYDDFTLLILAGLVYAIGLLGLRQPEVFHGVREAPSMPRYARSGMDESAAARHREALLRVMHQEKPYLDPDLTLQGLADRVGISPHNLTEVLSTQVGENFHDFVNGHRVREARARLADPANDGFTVLAIGLDSGFKSKSAFNAVFKKRTGKTPSQERR